MDELNKDNSTFVDEESSFDIREWLLHFSKYWYLFVVSVAIALSVSYLKNRSWVEEHLSNGTLIVDSRRTGHATGGNSIMQGFGIQSGYRNIENQIVMLKSNDLLSRVVDSLPALEIDYITKGRFRTRSIYKYSPIRIKKDFISSEAYRNLYKIDLKSDGTFVITINEDKSEPKFKLTGELGKPVFHDWFIITIDDLRSQTTDMEMHFRFRTKQSLISEFSSRVNINWLSDETSILNVDLVSSMPARDVDFINKLCEVFIEENLELKNDVAIRTIGFINGQIELLSKSLNESQGDLTSFRQRNQIINSSTFSNEILSRATKYDEKKRELELRELYLNYLVDHIEKNVDDGSIIAPLSLGINDAVLVGLVQDLNSKYIEKAKLSERNPFYDKILTEIDIVKQSMAEVIKSMHKSLDIEKKETDRKLKETQEEISLLPEKELEMVAIERQVKLDDTYYTFFLQKRAEAEIQKASNRPDHSILDKARTLQMTNGNAKRKFTIQCFFIGFLIPFLFVLLLKLLNTKVVTVSDVEKSSAFPVIGSIRRTKKMDPMMLINKPRSFYAEMFRVIRTRIEFIVQRKTNIMMSVSSAESGDGKTYFSANLAAVYAMTQRKTLLVDMDIRKPNMYKYFDTNNEPGVTNYLIGEAKLEEIIKKTENEYYHLLTAGTIPPNPGEIIRSEKLKQMFDELRKEYDYIIVDTSPIGLVADAYSIALITDVNLFVTRLNKTKKQGIKSITAQLKDDEVSHIYTIINDVHAEQSTRSTYSSYGYNAYGYGSKFYSKKKREAAENFAKYYTDDEDI